MALIHTLNQIFLTEYLCQENNDCSKEQRERTSLMHSMADKVLFVPNGLNSDTLKFCVRVKNFDNNEISYQDEFNKSYFSILMTFYGKLATMNPIVKLVPPDVNQINMITKRMGAEWNIISLPMHGFTIGVCYRTFMFQNLIEDVFDFEVKVIHGQLPSKQ